MADRRIKGSEGRNAPGCPRIDDLILVGQYLPDPGRIFQPSPSRRVGRQGLDWHRGLILAVREFGWFIVLYLRWGSPGGWGDVGGGVAGAERLAKEAAAVRYCKPPAAL